MLSVEEASHRIRAALPAARVEELGISHADGRILARAMPALRTLPPWDNSAMDGFAVRAAELPGQLPIAGTIAAGDAPDRSLPEGAVLRIMTGAPMPSGADAVVMREDVDDQGEIAVFNSPARAGQHLRCAGEDVHQGQPVVAAGALLRPGEIGSLAAQGYARVPVGKRPRVMLLSTGDELVDVDVPPGPGQIVNSNAYALAAQVREAGGEVIGSTIVADDRSAMVAAVEDALSRADIVISSGGVSVGDFDFVKEAFADAKVNMDFWKIAMKPGKPLAFGTSESGVPVFGLPGNPVSSMVGFELFVRPSLLAMQGATQCQRPRQLVTLAQDYRKKTGRTHIVRAQLFRDGARSMARPHSKQGSGMLSSMVGIDGFLIIPADTGDVSAGTQLEAMAL